MKFQKTALAASVLFALSGPASARIIDLFDDPLSPPGQVNTDITVDSTPVTSSYTGTDIIGGTRDMSLNLDAGVSATARVANGRLSVSNDDASKSTLIVTWDKSGVGLGSIDFTDDGSNAIRIVATSQDQAEGFEFRFTVTSNGVDSCFPSCSTYQKSPNVTIPPTLEYDISYASFLNGGVNAWKDVDALKFEVVTLKDAADFSLDTIEQVPAPEPASLLLMGTGLLGLAGVRRRWMKKA